MPGGEIVMSLGVQDLGFLVVWVVTSVVSLGVPGVVFLSVTGVVVIGFPDKFSIWVPGKVVFLVSCGSMLTIIT